MDAAIPISPSSDFRRRLALRGGADASRCMQCATCTAVCDLTTNDATFPRRQMLWAQWGLADRLAADPSIWLCHQCNDCTARCPRDARPGDALQAMRAVVIEELGAPRAASRLVGAARVTWPLLLGAPVLLWALYIQAVNGFAVPRTPLVFGDVVPVWMIWTVFLPAAAFMIAAAFVGARRAWREWGAAAPRSGSLISGLALVAAEILGHRRFATCTVGRPRRTGHLLLLWGFVGALATTAMVGVRMDVLGDHEQMQLLHPIKLLGNASAILLVLGIVWLVANRVGNAAAAGASHAYDTFFVTLVVLVVFSGVGAEIARLALPAPVALGFYVVHLGMVLSLFLTLPFSKFAHALYRTLALAHARLAGQRRPS
jgi:quinone-modifying oxidoreductase subunit QmoC